MCNNKQHRGRGLQCLLAAPLHFVFCRFLNITIPQVKVPSNDTSVFVISSSLLSIHVSKRHTGVLLAKRSRFRWQVNLADLNSDEDQASKKIRLCIEAGDLFLCTG